MRFFSALPGIRKKAGKPLNPLDLPLHQDFCAGMGGFNMLQPSFPADEAAEQLRDRLRHAQAEAIEGVRAAAGNAVNLLYAVNEFLAGRKDSKQYENLKAKLKKEGKDAEDPKVLAEEIAACDREFVRANENTSGKDLQLVGDGKFNEFLRGFLRKALMQLHQYERVPESPSAKR